MKHHSLLFLCSLICLGSSAESIKLLSFAPDYTTAHLGIALDAQQTLLHNSIQLSTNSPELVVSSWRAHPSPREFFDTSSNVDHLGYQGSVELVVTFTTRQQLPVKPPTLFFHYLTTTQREIQEKRFLLPLHASPEAPIAHVETPSQLQASPKSIAPAQSMAVYPQSFTQRLYEGLHNLLQAIIGLLASAKSWISSLFTKTSSRGLQLILAFLLGILMSLTPCIYPMIPITVGLLGASPGQSFIRNLLLASSYTLGLALTFAGLGFITVLFGSQCGRVACNPFVILFLIVILAYSAGSMFGLYELTIPRFLKHSARVQQGSLWSAFFFGSASGLIASPCMTPGLALILSVVAALGNYFLGFLLLFAFGLGSSMPLLIIGTFSGSLALLPRAGVWMNEVKKIFGFMLCMMCFYYLHILLPLHLVAWAAAIFSALCGCIYLGNLFIVSSRRSFWYTIFIGMSLWSVGFYLAYVGTLAWYASKQPATSHILWLHEYEAARQQAQEKKQLMLIDFTASWCSLCVLLDKQILQHPDVEEIFTIVTPMQVKAGGQHDAQYYALTQKFAILGLPTILLIDPVAETVLRTWNSELLEQTPRSFVDEIRAHVSRNQA